MTRDSTPDVVTSTLVVPARPKGPSAYPAVVPAGPDDWRRVFAAMRTSRWLILAVTAVGTLAGIVGSRFLKPTYEARATVWLEIPDEASHARERGPIESAELFPTATGWLDLLRSHVLLDDVVRRWRLYLKPKSAADSAALATLTVPGDVRPGHYRLVLDRAGKRFRLLDADEKQVLQEATLGEAMGAAFGLVWVPPSGTVRPGGSVDFTVTTTSEAALKLADELRIRAAPEGNFVRIARRGPDPDQATGIANAVAERFVAAAADLKRQRLTELTAILQDQLNHAQENLRTAEAALTVFRVHNAVRPSEGPAQGPDGRRITADPTFASYVDVQVTLDGLTHDRQAETGP